MLVGVKHWLRIASAVIGQVHLGSAMHDGKTRAQAGMRPVRLRQGATLAKTALRGKAFRTAPPSTGRCQGA